MYAEQQQKYGGTAAATAGEIIRGTALGLDRPSPPLAPSQPEVGATMARLDDAIAENGKLVYALMERLNAVLIPTPETAGGNTSNKVGPSCRLASDLFEQGERMRSTNNTIRSMLAGLAL